MSEQYVAYATEPIPGLPKSMAQFTQVIRMYLRDYPELNRLLEGEEHHDRLIVWAILDALDDFNATPPPISVSFEMVPKSILKHGVVVTLLESLLFLNTRNSLAYSDGGINVNLDKTGPLLQMIQLMRQTYEQKRDRWKIAQNIAQGWNSIPSEYYIISGFYGAW